MSNSRKTFSIRDAFWLTIVAALGILVVVQAMKIDRQVKNSFELFAGSVGPSLYRQKPQADSVTFIKIQDGGNCRVFVAVCDDADCEETDCDEREFMNLGPGIWTLKVDIIESSKPMTRRMSCRCLETSKAINVEMTGDFTGRGVSAMQSGFRSLEIPELNQREYGLNMVSIATLTVEVEDNDRRKLGVFIKPE